MSQLPVTQLLPELCQVLGEVRRAVLAAPPGSGKTTLVPLELIRQPWLAGKKILMLEPRRLATRAAARRMAQLLGERVGETVGYQVRFEREISAATRIEVVTEGILTRRLQQDPELQDVGLIIFDEFHERSLHADLALALSLDVADNLREDLRLMVMSATLDTQAVAGLLGGVPVIVGEGRSHPVELRYLERPRPVASDISESVARGVQRALLGTTGDILAFLPGAGEIRRSECLLKPRLPDGVALFPLYGDLSRADQDAALTPSAGGRRVVLATSIAETSLTIEGIAGVVDSGWSRRPQFDPNSGLSRLRTVRVSAASADQRAGRAGRLGPGVCYRLWTRAEQAQLVPHQLPELLEADLAPLALELALWGVTDARELAWLDSPPVGAYAQARELLQRLDALDAQGRITPAGRRLVALGLHPRLAHLLLNAGAAVDRALDLAALLSERDIFRYRPGVSRSIDIEERLQRLAAWRQGRERHADGELDRAQCQQVERSARQWRRLLKPAAGCGDPTPGVGGLLSLAFPDRIAQRRPGSDNRYLLTSGRAVQIPEGDPLARHDYLVVAALDAGRREGRAYLAAPITGDEIRDLQAPHISRTRRVTWDPAGEAVVAREEERLGAVVLATRPLREFDADENGRAMLTGLRQMGLSALPWNDELQQWRQRVMSLRCWLSDSDWPDLSDERLLETLEQWLGPWLSGISRREHLKQLDLGAILNSRFSWEQQQQLDRLAPVALPMPSGSRRRLRYQAGEPPVLAVKLQELFGLRQTPTVCQGQVNVMIHLLSPAQRPIQVTQDLAGFWDRTYAEVRKELKGRYPKHYWPDDPASAVPTARVRPADKR